MDFVVKSKKSNKSLNGIFGEVYSAKLEGINTIRSGSQPTLKNRSTQ